LCDALATVVGSLLGTTTTGTYIESATGIEAGGRSGFTSIVTALLFLSALFFSPFFTAIPAIAYGPSLIIVGLLMMSPITKLNFNDFSEIVPAFTVIVLMSFTYNLGIGMTAGFVVYALFKILSGKISELNLGLWIFAILSVLFFIFYPY
ncbi:MAG: NCS2 family permease, partial [Bacteroidetes bacterium]|nr:NCS2 family permease [Bacteroidota bacterium]